MRRILYTQYYRCRQRERQAEIDRCLEINLLHPGLDKVVVLREHDAPPIPPGTVECEVIDWNERLTYSHWLSLAKQEPDSIALLVNSDIYLAEGLEHLEAVFDTPKAFMALSRYNPEPGCERLRLNAYPHWTQDTWGIRTDAPVPQSLLYSSTFSLGFPGCDNRIAYVMWSHGFQVKNPGYFVKTVHEHQEVSRPYDTHADRLYGGVSYVHLSLSPSEPSELEHTIWTQSAEIGGGLLINQQPIGKGVHRFVADKGTDVDRFQHLQKFTGLSWSHQARGSSMAQVMSNHPLAGDRQHVSDHTLALPMAELTGDGISVELPGEPPLLGLFLRLPRHSAPAYGIAIEARNGHGAPRHLLEEEARIDGQSRRNFLEGGRVQGHFSGLKLKLRPLENETQTWGSCDLAELVLFCEKSAEPEKVQADSTAPAAVAEAEGPGPDPAWGAYQVVRRQDFEPTGQELVKRFGSRFEVWCDGKALYFVDRFWPTVGCVAFSGTAKAALSQGEEALFAVGFLQPLLEWKPNQIASEKKHRDHLLFWQYPCRTEEDAFLVHQEFSGPQLDGESYQLYLGLPWATFIDRGVNHQIQGDPYPEPLLLAMRKRTEALAEELMHWGRKLQVHSVCQHIFWREATARIRSAGVTDLWISHKEKGLDEEEGMRLHSWSLYAVNDRDPARRKGLHFVPIEQRPVFASFSGAHMKHYLSDVRQRMASLSALEGYQVTIKDMWHFNKVVYNFQVFGDESKKDAIATDEVLEYNTLLSHTRFSLCPVGAGPNTLRLWESLAVGAIPVVLSDRHQLPDLERLLPGEGLSWEQVVVLHPEAELNQLDARLKAIDAAERHRRQRLCRRVYEASVAMTCFGRSAREAEPIAQLLELFKPQQVQVPGRTTAEFTGVARQVPASLTLSEEGPSELLVHLDQTEQLLGFRLTGTGCTMEEVSVSISRYREYNKFEELPLEVERQWGDGQWLRLPESERWWAMGVKLTAEWKQQGVARPEAGLQLAVLSEKDAFAREARRLDQAGILKAASDRNEERQDDTFDTKHINSGLILERLPAVARPEDVVPGQELFPALAAPSTNLIGEPLGDGITMYVHLMNRNENVRKNLANWLQQQFDELILLDWSSSDPVAEIPGVFDDPRVRVVRVDGQRKFIRTVAQNLASRMARHRRIFKCDSDVEFHGNFFDAHPLEPGEFWVGDWHHARDNNERHLHGETFYFIEDFLAVGGYDERIKSYGQDDTNLKDRMALAGIVKNVFNYDFMEHQHHEQTVRAQGSNGIHPMVATYANRVMTRSSPLWNGARKVAQYHFHSEGDITTARFELKSSIGESTTSDHIKSAVYTIGRWYLTHDKISTMTEDQVNAVIWEKQVE
ncbi:exostosin family protein [Cyanobium sp. Lug-B]|uniref:exostosin domain-containing protein n=1 Tax=Cyanobium sp. Lug-B TaxID=2823716 RepID=UPI0020CD0813|nr:exostosin family protein [Cyanobium sp. Lug-B]MCP9797729.1 exostosin family protein [Cyanobium sp. Lug-B]